MFPNLSTSFITEGNTSSCDPHKIISAVFILILFMAFGSIIVYIFTCILKYQFKLLIGNHDKQLIFVLPFFV